MTDTYNVLFVDYIDSDEDIAALAQAQASQTEGLEVGDTPAVDALDPVSVALIAGAVAIGIAKLIGWVVRQVRGGLRIDLSADPVTVQRDRAIDAGVVVIVAADKKSVEIKTVDVPKDELDGLFEAILKLPREATLALVKDAIKDAIGEKATDDKKDSADAPAS